MEKFLWLISHFSARILVYLLCIPNALWLVVYYDSGKLLPYIKSHMFLLIAILCVTIIASIILGYIGGKAGYQYADMGRSRRWHYRNTQYSRGDSTFRNVFYWACKFALLPVILLLFTTFIVGIIYVSPHLCPVKIGQDVCKLLIFSLL